MIIASLTSAFSAFHTDSLYSKVISMSCLQDNNPASALLLMHGGARAELEGGEAGDFGLEGGISELLSTKEQRATV